MNTTTDISASTIPVASAPNNGIAPSPCTSADSKSSTITSKSTLQLYCEGQLDAIQRMNEFESLHTPASFVAIAAFIGYLSRLAYGSNRGHDPDAKFYIKFITDVLGVVKSDYRAIATDMYYVFRCGLVHAYSFCPPTDAPTPTYNIAISHSVGAKWVQGSGFYQVSKDGKLYTVLNAEDLIQDLFKSIEAMFKDPILGPHAIHFGTVQPPIQQI